jgi:hypothetical protein
LFIRFGMDNGLDRDTLSLLKKRVYDIAGITRGLKVEISIASFPGFLVVKHRVFSCKQCQIFLNGVQLKFKSFQEYIQMFKV